MRYVIFVVFIQGIYKEMVGIGSWCENTKFAVFLEGLFYSK